eukprot:SAG11_NODE_12474_length_701_cov_1.275748_1_plen_82_part_00
MVATDSRGFNVRCLAVAHATSELFVNVNEYLPLIKERLIDYVRVHMSDIGGITPMRKLAALCGTSASCADSFSQSDSRALC